MFRYWLDLSPSICQTSGHGSTRIKRRMVLNNPRPTDAPGFILCPVTNMKLEFAKLSGSGNDFVCIDNRDGKYDRLINSPPHIRRFANALCRRGLGIGADGVIFACATEVEDFSDIAA